VRITNEFWSSYKRLNTFRQAPLLEDYVLSNAPAIDMKLNLFCKFSNVTESVLQIFKCNWNCFAKQNFSFTNNPQMTRITLKICTTDPYQTNDNSPKMEQNKRQAHCCIHGRQISVHYKTAEWPNRKEQLSPTALPSCNRYWDHTEALTQSNKLSNDGICCTSNPRPKISTLLTDGSSDSRACKIAIIMLNARR
jgi:hypothetical protein